MINFIFDKQSESLKVGTDIIIKKIGIDTDLKISVKKSDKLFIQNDAEGGSIEYITDASYFRMLSLFFKEYKKKDTFTYEEKIYFDKCGPMLDMSRNAVLKVEKVKDYIEYIAMMGLNRLVLYIEDIYELKDYPYFGYMRGRYTKEELMEIDKYALQFGIEVFPAIQTLGHMERYMHWDESFPVRDTMHCLLSGEEKTYEFIEAMIKTLSETFTSNVIHVGMDEAFDFGLGKYLQKNGYHDRSEIILAHLNRVNEIAKKYNVSIHMWSDMFFRLASKNGGYNAEGLEVSEELKKLIPDNATLVYWSYSEEDEDKYTKMIKAHHKMSDNLSFAGSSLDYFGHMCDTINTYRITQIALNSCKKNNVRDIYATIWGDNGGECDLFLSLCSVQLYAENMYNDSNYIEHAKENFEFITGASFDAFMDMSQFHNIFDGREYKYWWFRYVGKRLLYQDILASLCDDYLKEGEMSAHYKHYAEKMNEYISGDNRWNVYYSYSHQLFDVLAKKCEIAENLRNAYLDKNFDYLKEVAENKLDALYKSVQVLRKQALDLWYTNNKAFGGEVLDIRLNGLLGRIETSKARLSAFVNGEIERIEELEVERLPFSSFNASQYAAMVTAGIM